MSEKKHPLLIRQEQLQIKTTYVFLLLRNRPVVQAYGPLDKLIFFSCFLLGLFLLLPTILFLVEVGKILHDYNLIAKDCSCFYW